MPVRTELWRLMAAYLFEDFDMYGGVWEAVSAFFEESSAADTSKLIHDIDQLLAEKLDDAGLQAILADMGCAVSPPTGARDYRGFLEQIAERARAHLAGHPG